MSTYGDFGVVLFRNSSNLGFTENCGGFSGMHSWWRHLHCYAVLTPGSMVVLAVVNDYGDLVEVPWSAQ